MLTDTQKPKSILIINVCNPLSYGGAAITTSLLKLLKTTNPYLNVTLMVTRGSDAGVYQKKYGMNNINFIKHTWYRPGKTIPASIMHSSLPAASAFFRCLFYTVLHRFGIKISNIYEQYDIILDLNTDSLNEHYGIVYPLFTFFELLLVLLCNKKVVICPSSIGPFRNKFIKQLAKFVLGKVNLIIVREEHSRDYLKALGISRTKIHLAADLAFLLEPVSFEEARALLKREGFEKTDRPLIGIAPSQIIHRYASLRARDKIADKYQKYVKLMAEISDFVIEKFDSIVIFIPHSIDTQEFSKNDKIICRKIYLEVKNKQRVKLIQRDYTAHEIKGIIKLCDVFIGCRMHSAIASMSSGVPTVALAYGHKFHGLLGKMMGQRICIINVESDVKSVLRLLKHRVEYVWENKDSIKGELQERTKTVQAQARLLKEIMTSVIN